MSSSIEFTGITSGLLHAVEQKMSAQSHLMPIYATSTFTYDDCASMIAKMDSPDKRAVYSRWQNPNFEYVEELISYLESYQLFDKNKIKALLHASGQSAMTTLFLGLLQKGDTILSHYSLYGGTHELFHKILPKLGIQTIIVDFRKKNEIASALKNNRSIKLIHIETPSNPTNQCLPIEFITKLAHEFHCKVSVDNTFATPILQQPFKYQVDFIIHSTTKFLNGHGTSIGGVLLGRDLDFMQHTAWKYRTLLGSTPSPFDAYLLMNGIKTLELRMQKHCSNAWAVAEFLNKHPKIHKVNFLGLPTHPEYTLARQQLKQPVPVFSFEVQANYSGTQQFINNLKMCTRAVSLGSLDTLIAHPASMIHKGVSAEEKKQSDITDSLVRISVGLEQANDIIADLDQALKSI
ncbi:MAG: aminotransferase class I/II-fold pyridoxal phosphate-dependent enzyme [Phycisphaerales bacterium]|nr:aminotransferase class I/II-fold pyridoxal phosphate-dependent enzyme [Phycisphaerales bacterium]